LLPGHPLPAVRAPIPGLGRSLADLIDTLRALEAANVDLYLDQQAIDTTTPVACSSM
jgi:hypothetical protein